MDKERVTPDHAPHAPTLDDDIYTIGVALKTSAMIGIAFEAGQRVLDALALERRGRVYAEKRLDEIRKVVR